MSIFLERLMPPSVVASIAYDKTVLSKPSLANIFLLLAIAFNLDAGCHARNSPEETQRYRRLTKWGENRSAKISVKETTNQDATKPACAKCQKKEQVVPIVSGKPGPSLYKAYQEGKVFLGSCAADDDRNWYCKACKLPFKGNPPDWSRYESTWQSDITSQRKQRRNGR